MSLSAAPGGVIAATPRLMASIAERERALSPLNPIDGGIRLLLPSTDSLSELEHAVTSARRNKPAAKRLRSFMRREKDSLQNGLTEKFFRLRYREQLVVTCQGFLRPRDTSGAVQRRACDEKAQRFV